MFQAQIRTTIVSSGGRTTPSPRSIARREPPTRVEVLFALLLFDSILISLCGMSRTACVGWSRRFCQINGCKLRQHQFRPVAVSVNSGVRCAGSQISSCESKRSCVKVLERYKESCSSGNIGFPSRAFLSLYYHYPILSIRTVVLGRPPQRRRPVHQRPTKRVKPRSLSLRSSSRHLRSGSVLPLAH